MSTITYMDVPKKWYKQKKRTYNADAVLINLLRYMKVPVTALTAKEVLQDHPTYPSLASLKDTLAQWRIKSVPLFLEVSELDEISYPAIAHTGIEGGHFVLLTKKESDVIHFIDPISGWRQLPTDEFSKIWSGATLLVEAHQNSGEAHFKRNKTKTWLVTARLPFIMIASCLLIFSVMSLGYGTFGLSNIWLPLLLIKITGGGLSMLLVANELHEGNALVNKLCNIHKNINCQRVLQSNALSVGLLNFSELGAFYFLGGTFTLLLAVLSKNVALIIQLEAVFNLTVLPFTLFSVFYQGLVIKKWCPLCLAVQVILWMEFVLMYNTRYYSLQCDALTISVVLWGYLLPLLLWMIFRHTYVKSKQSDDLKRLLNRFRGNKDIFATLLSQQNKIAVGELTSEIVIGDPEAKHTVVMVTNTDCGPCAHAHYEITNLMAITVNKIKIVYRFTNDTPVVRHIINAALMEGNKKASGMLAQWYSQKDESKITKNGNMNGNADKISEILGEHLVWCNDVNISKTPTILLNGKEIPNCYKIADLRYLID